MMYDLIYSITANMVFPEGLVPGSGSFSNNIYTVVDGAGRPVLRGTAIAGVIRHAYEAKLERDGLDRSASSFWFGEAVEDNLNDRTSAFRVADSVIDMGKSSKTIRMHNTINRHTGAPIARGLFSMEALPSGSRTVFHFAISSEKECEDDCERFISTIAAILKSHLVFGGCGNRGVGRAVVDGDVLKERFDLSTPKGYEEWLNRMYLSRKNGIVPQGNPVRTEESQNKLQINLILATPRGEDIVIGDCHGLDFDLEPQTATLADGTTRFRIPGSTLRGVIRAWMTRLAARDGCAVSDSYKQFDESTTYKPDDLAWGFVAEGKRAEYREDPKKLNDPILSLFGSMYAAGRIHIADSYSNEVANREDISVRKHVAVDRFSGGANESALFTNSVLAASRQEFSVSITIEFPTQQEAKWLTKTLRAMHLGLLSVGSSKASGRLAIKSLGAAGPQSEVIMELDKDLEVIK